MRDEKYQKLITLHEKELNNNYFVCCNKSNFVWNIGDTIRYDYSTIHNNHLTDPEESIWMHDMKSTNEIGPSSKNYYVNIG